MIEKRVILGKIILGLSLELGISKYLGEDISCLGRGKIPLLLFALEMLNFLKLSQSPSLIEEANL